MFNPAAQAQCQQQWMNGVMSWQQGVMAEQQGNLVVAAQLYEQSAGWIQQSVANAVAWGIQVPDGVHANLGVAYYSAARAATTFGNGPLAWQRYGQALMEFNQAIALNPAMAPYHFGAGIVLMLMGNLPEADRAFSTACQLAPGDPMAQNMLATVRSMEGASVGVPAAGPAPAPMPAWFPQPGGGGIPQSPPEHAGGSGWLEKINEVCTTIDKVVGTIGNVQGLVQGSQGGGGF